MLSSTSPKKSMFWFRDAVKVKVKVAQSCLPLCDPTDYPWNSPGQNIGVGSHSLLQRIFPPQGSTPGLPHCGWILYQLSHKGSPRIVWIKIQVRFIHSDYVSEIPFLVLFPLPHLFFSSCNLFIEETCFWEFSHDWISVDCIFMV